MKNVARAVALPIAVLAAIAAAVACDAFGGEDTSPALSDGGVQASDGNTTDTAPPNDGAAPRSIETLAESNCALIAMYGASIYWALDSGEVRTCQIDACQTTTKTLANGYDRAGKPTGMAVDESGVYLAIYLSQVVYRVPLEPSTTPIVIAEYPLGNGPLPYGVALDATRVVWTEQSGDAVRMRPKISTASPDGGAVVSSQSGGFIRAIAIGGDSAFWLSGDHDNPAGRLDSVSLSGGNAHTTFGIPGPRGVAVSNNAAFVSSWLAPGGDAAGVIFRIIGESPPSTLAVNQPQPTAIVTDGARVYWANLGDGTIRSCQVEGCATKESVVVETHGAPESIAVDANAIYWCERINGKIQRAPK